jgi:hypothetical protein
MMRDPSKTRSTSRWGAVSFDLYGFRVAVESDDDGVLEDIQRDFSYFSKGPGEESALVEVISESVPRALLPRLKATLQTPRNIVYRKGDVSYVDYFGRALTIRQGKEKAYKIYCNDRDLAHEITFLTILSQVGQHLDAIGLHRVHALGIEAGGRAMLILLPVSGGKTTLALRILCSEGIKLLSEDSPLISRSGEVFPFPLRIGVRVGDEPSGIPSKYSRTVKRMEFDPKTLIDIEYFRKKIGEPCQIGSILLGERWLAGPSSIRPERRRCAIKAFIKNSVVGLGLYQGIEFVLERTALEILGKAGVAFSRFRNSVEVIRRSQVYRFAMGPDAEQNAEVLVKFIRESSSHFRTG